MKKQNGITLVSLILYVVIMIITLGMMSTILTSFRENTTNLGWDVQQIVEFNKFNTYFLKEIKRHNNKVNKMESTDDIEYIQFNTGNSFFKNKEDDSIYFNENEKIIKICNNVRDMKIIVDETNDKIITVWLEFESFSKSIKYKIENIY